MTPETATRPTCVYAAASLRKNSTKLLVTMCVGIALAMYGAYVQIRSHSNPGYAPSISTASEMVQKMLATTWMSPKTLLRGCNSGSVGSKGSLRQTAPEFLMRVVVKPIVHYSGVVNGFFNIIQIIMLKVYCRSISATDAIIVLSVMGWIMSMVCVVGAYATCKVMCISCLGIHHIVIVYLGVRRRRILKNILCPAENTTPTSNNCSVVSGIPTSERIFGVSNSASQPQSGKKRNTSAERSMRRRPEANR